VIGRSAKGEIHHVTVKWLFGKMTSGVLPGKNWQVQKNIGKYILEMVSFRIEKNYIFLYSKQSPTKIHT